METFYNDLKNQFTLAPLNENRQKLEEFYAPQHIGAKDTAILSSLSKNSIASLEASIGALSHLLQKGQRREQTGLRRSQAACASRR